MAIRSDLTIFQDKVRILFMEELEKITPSYNSLVSMVSSDGATETLAWWGSVPKMHRYTGTPEPTDLPGYDWTIYNYQWSSELRFDVSRGRGLDSQLQMTSSLVEEAIQFMEERFWRLFNRDETDDCFSGSTFINDTHTYGAATLDNKISGSGVATSADIISDFASALTRLRYMTTDTGDRYINMGVSPSDMVIICPPDIENELRQAMTAELIDGTTNTMRMINPDNIISSPYLTDKNDWYLAFKDSTIKKALG